MAASVLLRHALPDGSIHFDWMVEGSGGGLTAFRVAERIDVGPPSFDAERLPDHRKAYLDYEGTVSGGRGEVARIATGRLTVEADDGARFIARGRLGAASGKFEGARGPRGPWRFTFTPENVGGGG